MACSFLWQKSTVATVVGLTLVMTLVACTSDQRYKRQVMGDEVYLNTAPLKSPSVPSGIILPVQSDSYEIPTNVKTGVVGKELDIRPPQQSFALRGASGAQYDNGTSTLLFESSTQETDLWLNIVDLLQMQNVPVTSRQDTSQSLITDWVQWQRLDEDNQYEGRYQISLQPQEYQQALVVKMLELRQSGKNVTNASETQRYSILMMNAIVEGLEYQADQKVNQSTGGVGALQVQSSTDDSGLPLLIVRAPYSVAWQHSPTALEKLGMKVGKRDSSQSRIDVTYKPLDSNGWQALGVRDPQLEEGDYQVHVGDLNNRTSLQFIDAKGKTLPEAQNDALAAALQAVFGKINVK